MSKRRAPPRSRPASAKTRPSKRCSTPATGGSAMTNASLTNTVPAATTPSAAKPAASRTRLLLEGSIVATLLRLAAPNVVVNVVLIAVTATVDAHFVGRMGPQALAGLSLVFPLIMLMQQMANSSMGGAIASAIARAIGAGRHADASALVVHGIIIAAAMTAIFSAVLLLGGPAIYRLVGGSGETRAAALEYSNAIFAGAFAYWLLSTLTSVVRGAGQAAVLALVYIAAEARHRRCGHRHGHFVHGVERNPVLVRRFGANRNPTDTARYASRPAAVHRNPARRRAAVAAAHPQQSGACHAHGFRRRLGRGATGGVRC